MYKYLPVLHSLSTQSSISSKSTALSMPMLMSAPAPPCIEYVNVGALHKACNQLLAIYQETTYARHRFVPNVEQAAKESYTILALVLLYFDLMGILMLHHVGKQCFSHVHKASLIVDSA